ncbi:MAG: glycerophosphodiester phosphodiesterase [Polyangiales bacterium]|nr:glycerophosphodiester phosphodiesterase [Sandaracinaceae bacterium]
MTDPRLAVRRQRTAYLGQSPYAYAHRGGVQRWPENTLVAFRGAVALGYTHIETDVHLTRDGHIVCLHDATLERTTNGRGLLKELTLSELRELDAGYRFTQDGGRTFPYRGQGVTVPTLEEALAVDPGLRLNLEMKQRAPDMVAPLLDFIEAHGVAERVLVASARDDLTRRFRALRDARGLRVVTSPGARGIVAFWLSVRLGVHRLLRFDFDALQVPVQHGPLRVVDRRFVEAAHAHGIHVHVWTINDPAEMRRLYDLGVDAVMTDCPDVLLEVLGEVRAGLRGG